MSRSRLASVVQGPGREAVIVALVLLLVRPALLPDPRPVVGAMNDDAVYVALGRAIAEGAGYRSVYLPGDPVQVRYPPGLPAVLAVLWRIAGTLDGVAALALGLNAILIALAAALLYWLARRRLGLQPGLAAPFVVAPFLLDPSLLYSELILSEPYFVAGWAAALNLACRVPELEPGRRRILAAAALGLVLAATTLMRAQGAALVPALLIALFFKRVGGSALAATAACALAPLAAWNWIHAGWAATGPLSTAADEASYLAWTGVTSAGSAVKTLGAAATLNFMRYVVVFSSYLSDLMLFGFLVVIGLVTFAVGGALRRLRSEPGLVLGTAAMAGLALAWPFTQDRLVLPLLPFAGLLAASEVQRLLRVTRRGRILILTALLLTAVSVTLRQATMRHHVNARLAQDEPAAFYTPTDYVRRTSRKLLAVVEWVRANTVPTDVVMAAFPGGVYLHTGRKALPAEPARRIVGRGIFEVPGAYLAGQILAEEPSVLVVHELRPGRVGIAQDADEVGRRCPGVLERMESAPRAFLAAYRIRADRPCLTAIARAGGWVPRASGGAAQA